MSDNNMTVNPNTTYPCMSSANELETYMQLPEVAEDLKRQGKIDEYMKYKFTEADLLAIQNRYGLGMNHLHLSASITENAGIQKPNGELCYTYTRDKHSAETLIADMKETCVPTLEAIGSKNAEGKCETLIESFKPREEKMTLEEMIILGFVVFGLFSPAGNQLFTASIALLKKAVNNYLNNRNPPSGGSGTGGGSSIIETPSAHQVQKYGKPYVSSSMARGMLELYNVEGENLLPDLQGSTTLPDVAITTSSNVFIPANPTTVFAPIKITMPAIRPIPRPIPVVR